MNVPPQDFGISAKGGDPSGKGGPPPGAPPPGAYPGGPMPGGKGGPMPGGKGKLGPYGGRSPEEMIRYEQARIRHMKKDTYQARRKEGRTKHGQTSWTVIILGAFSWFLMAASVGLPEWRASRAVVFGYGFRRGWGMFAVKGRSITMHHTVSQQTCGWFGSLNLGNMCSSPLCLWYKVKCETYIDMMILSYACGAAMIVALIVHLCCVVFTVQFTPRTIRWAASWWPVPILLNTAAVMTWFFLTEDMFARLNAESVYPEPPPGYCMYLGCIALLFQITCCMLGCMLMGWWPEINEDSSDEEEESDSDDEPKKKNRLTANRGPSKGGYGKGYGMDPGKGYGMDPGMGYGMDPGKGYGMDPGKGQGKDQLQGKGFSQDPQPGPGFGQEQGMDLMPASGQGYQAPPDLGKGGSSPTLVPPQAEIRRGDTQGMPAPPPN